MSPEEYGYSEDFARNETFIELTPEEEAKWMELLRRQHEEEEEEEEE